LDGFLAGDDAEAKKPVAAILEQIGFRQIDVGPLAMARCGPPSQHDLPQHRAQRQQRVGSARREVRPGLTATGSPPLPPQERLAIVFVA
jgi:hypothetical protein